MKPFFDVKVNNELYSYMLDTYYVTKRPENSNHINGVIFEPSNEGRDVDTVFGKMVDTCEFLAKHYHGKNNLELMSEDRGGMLSYTKLKEITAGEGELNSVYGSIYGDGVHDLPESIRIPFQDWIDDYDKTGAYIDGKKYLLGQSHAIDDFDEGSVWFYVTMTEPLEDLNQVVEIEDIMPFVFWWENRGSANNGPTVDCYGLSSSSKLNYEKGGWCYSSGYDRREDVVTLDPEGHPVHSDGDLTSEHRWHAVQHTIGTDFSKP